MKIIYISDLHLKIKLLYNKAHKKFLKYLQENYNDVVMVFGGDIFDSSSPMWEVYSMFEDFLNKRNNTTHILQGNHDISKRKGSALNGIHLTSNVKVYFQEEVVDIEGMKCMMLPYQYNMDHYKDIKFDGDFTFGHYTNVEDQFDNEGIEIEGISDSTIQIFAHTHTHNIYKKKKHKIIAGVPIITRNRESNHPILSINTDDKSIEYIETPKFLDIVNIEYGEELPNLDYLYNIKNAPSYKAIYETYPNDNIVHSGISIKSAIDDGDESGDNLNFNEQSFQQLFKSYCEDNNLSTDIKTTGIKYLEVTNE